MKLDRRDALSLIALTSAAPLAARAKTAKSAVAAEFNHGVASGDPLSDRVILWTRVTPKAQISGSLQVGWEIAADNGFANVVRRGTTTTNADRDFTVKVDAGGLKAGREYHYRFHCGGGYSPAGRTKTLPVGPTNRLVFAVTSCALYPAGYFNAYDHMSKLEHVDAVIELGDYYYEYGQSGSDAGRKTGRVFDPPHDLDTLADYRARHAQYKSDADLQAAHARAPWICAWDDHETANDSWNGGAQHHDPAKDGPWVLRERAALQAYYEWMPIREPGAGQALEAINRTFQFGDLASLIMLETRLIARSHQLSYDRPGDLPLAVYDSDDPAKRKRVTEPRKIDAVLAAVKAGNAPPEPYVIGPDVEGVRTTLADPLRQMLGARQEEWLALEIAKSVKSGTPWQILGNGVVMARMRAPDFVQTLGIERVRKMIADAPVSTRARLKRFVDFYSFDVPWDLDAWDGYPAARERVYDAIKGSNGNAIVLAGDTHSFWVNQLYDAAGTTRVAAEFGGTSVTSSSFGDAFRDVDLASIFTAQNKEVLFNDQFSRGYLVVTVTHSDVTADLVSTTITAKPYSSKVVGSYRVTPADGAGIGPIEKI